MKLINIISYDLFDKTVNMQQFYKLYYCLIQSACDCDGTINLFKEWGGFALKFGSLISFFIGAYFTELRFYSDFDIWASKGRDVQIKKILKK